jgi:hypothetical protein
MSAWTDDELKQLTAIVAAGGTAFRAAAKFKRSMPTDLRAISQIFNKPAKPSKRL